MSVLREAEKLELETISKSADFTQQMVINESANWITEGYFNR